MLYTLFIIVLFRIGSQIPVPFVMAGLANQAVAQEGLFAYFNMLSGEVFSRGTLFALSISPYITASIVIQLLTIAVPALERMAKEGEEGRKKITQITRYATVALALITAIGYYAYIKSMGWSKAEFIKTAYAILSSLRVEDERRERDETE
jgi:preprotein translocase subunit SecY